jgi:hypothetical protein
MPVALNVPAIVLQLRSDEVALQTEHGRSFVSAARNRQLIIRAVARSRRESAQLLALRPSERDDIMARRDLDMLSAQSPPQVGGVTIGNALPPTTLLRFYREAQRRFGIRWQLLGAINFIESDFGRARTTARADAQGPMQFEHATWRAYGMGGDVYSAHDSILAAANLLAANGGRRSERAALMHYNLSPLYRDAVLRLAHRMRTVAAAFREYYAWRLFLRHTP